MIYLPLDHVSYADALGTVIGAMIIKCLWAALASPSNWQNEIGRNVKFSAHCSTLPHSIRRKNASWAVIIHHSIGRSFQYR